MVVRFVLDHAGNTWSHQKMKTFCFLNFDFLVKQGSGTGDTGNDNYNLSTGGLVRCVERLRTGGNDLSGDRFESNRQSTQGGTSCRHPAVRGSAPPCSQGRKCVWGCVPSVSNMSYWSSHCGQISVNSVCDSYKKSDQRLFHFIFSVSRLLLNHI